MSRSRSTDTLREPRKDCRLCRGKGLVTKRTDGGGATDGEFSYDVWCECRYRPATDTLPSDESTTWHDEFARCPECKHATVGSSGQYAIHHREGCSMPVDPTPDPMPEPMSWQELATRLGAEKIALHDEIEKLRATVDRLLPYADAVAEARAEGEAARTAEIVALRDRLTTMNECVRIYVQMREAGTPARPGWLEEEVAATDAVAAKFNPEANDGEADPDLHDLPDGEATAHSASAACGCNPDAFYDEDKRVWRWTHHRFEAER